MVKRIPNVAMGGVGKSGHIYSDSTAPSFVTSYDLQWATVDLVFHHTNWSC